MGRFVLVCIAAAVGLTSWAGGYLSVVGPKALRIQPPPTPPSPVALPPLPPADTNPTPSLPPETATTIEVPIPDEQPAEPMFSVSAGEPVTNFVSSILGPLMGTPEQQLLTPQMLIPYFRDIEGGSNLSKVVVAPVTFVPPLPTTKPSSKATYNVLPPPAPQR